MEASISDVRDVRDEWEGAGCMSYNYFFRLMYDEK